MSEGATLDSDLILEIPNFLPKYICDEIINFHDNYSKVEDGVLGWPGRVDKNFKTSMDMYLSFDAHKTKDPELLRFDKILNESLSNAIEIYMNKTKEYAISIDNDIIHDENLFKPFGDLKDHGYQVQRTDTDGFYKWHHDFALCKNDGGRVLTYIWYLNTLEPEQEGNTEFLFIKKNIRPEAGKFVLFPATWNMIHRGGILKYGKKYIVTGWLYSLYG